ncbi:hypothetical protein GGF46_004618 [Coemansia sp. RSA 552]|nr:hypothetical protein GGF46_004618 [Coemansia sp. RSA 552]
MDAVIVTGASKGIGRQVCVELLSLPVAVVAVARSPDALLSLADHAPGPGVLHCIVGDITHPPTQDSVIAAISPYRLRALINNAATVTPTGPLLSHTPDEWRRIWELNFLAPVSLASRCLEHFRGHQRSRVIINVTSSTSQAPVSGFGPYGSTKTALNYVTKALAAEYPDLTSIAFYPGVVDTQMNGSALGAANATNERVDMSAVIEKLQAPIPAKLPSTIIANLALHADHDLSGKYVVYSDSEMEEYRQQPCLDSLNP